MEDHVAPVDVLRENRLVHHGVDRVVKALSLLEMVDVLDRAGGEIVQRVYLVARVEERLGEMGADKAGTARDQHAHRRMVSRRESKIDHVTVSHEVVFPLESHEPAVTAGGQ